MVILVREIKFRAWDGKKMHYQVRFGGVKDGIPLSPSGWDEKYGWTILSGNPVLEIMQFTGLYDKNGKEIYEGDIVINTGLWYLPSTIKIQHVKERYGEGEIFVVNFNITGVELRHKDNWVMDKEKQFPPNGFIGKPYVDNHDAWNYQKSLEIIGNIYENLELLEGEKHD